MTRNWFSFRQSTYPRVRDVLQWLQVAHEERTRTLRLSEEEWVQRQHRCPWVDASVSRPHWLAWYALPQGKQSVMKDETRMKLNHSSETTVLIGWFKLLHYQYHCSFQMICLRRAFSYFCSSAYVEKFGELLQYDINKLFQHPKHDNWLTICPYQIE